MTRRSLVLLGAMLLSSCSPPEIEIAVSGSGPRPTLTLRQDWGIIFRDRKAPCIDEVIVYLNRQDQPAWRIAPVNEVHCHELGSLTIGVVPADFRESVPFSAPLHGNYTIFVRGIGMGSTTINL